MKKQHIAFFTLPVHSHVNVTLDTTRFLLERGYRVTHATTEYYQPRIEKIGAETVIYNPPSMEEWVAPDETQGAHDPLAYQWFLANAARLYTLDALHTLDQVFDFFDTQRPDLIIYDSTNCAGRFLARLWHIPAVQICPHFAFHKDFFSSTGAAWCNPKPPISLCNQLDIFFRTFFPAEKLNVHFIPPAFQYNADQLDDNFYFAGPCISRRAITDPLGLKRRKNPIILVSATTGQHVAPSYYRIMIDALTDTPFDVILSIGDRMDPLSLGALPDNFEINQYVSHHEILPYASLFIGTGGMTSTGEALYYGVPMVMIPASIFHADAAYRVEQLGLGKMINRLLLTKDNLREAALSVIESQEIRKKVDDMQQTILGVDAAEAVANRIHDYLTNHPPTTSGEQKSIN